MRQSQFKKAVMNMIPIGGYDAFPIHVKELQDVLLVINGEDMERFKHPPEHGKKCVHDRKTEGHDGDENRESSGPF